MKVTRASICQQLACYVNLQDHRATPMYVLKAKLKVYHNNQLKNQLKISLLTAGNTFVYSRVINFAFIWLRFASKMIIYGRLWLVK